MHGNSREDLAYFAGLFDGEGSIMIVRQNGESFMKTRIHPYIGPACRMGLINKDIIYAFQKAVNVGCVYIEKPYHRKRPMTRWQCRKKKEVRQFLELMMPYLRLKKENALLALEFLDKFPPTKKISKEKHEAQFEYYLKMRLLNGIAELPATTERMGKRGRCKSIRLKQQSELI